LRIKDEPPDIQIPELSGNFKKVSSPDMEFIGRVDNDQDSQYNRKEGYNCDFSKIKSRIRIKERFKEIYFLQRRGSKKIINVIDQPVNKVGRQTQNKRIDEEKEGGALSMHRKLINQDRSYNAWKE